MAEMTEVAPLALFDAIEDYVARSVASAVEPLKQQIVELRNQLAERPVELQRAPMRGLSAFEIAKKYGFDGDAIAWLGSLRGKDFDPAMLREEVERSVAAAVARLPTPEPGRPGKDVDQDVLRAMVANAAADAIKALPPAEKVDYDKIGDIIALAVAKEVAKIPEPKNGKDADPALILEAIAKAFDAFPKPRDADEDAIQARVLAEVVKQIPPPIPGKDADAALVEPIVAKAVAERLDPALAAIGNLDAAVKRLDAEPKFDATALPRALDASEVEAIALRVATDRFAAVPKGIDADGVRAIVGDLGAELFHVEAPAVPQDAIERAAASAVEKAIAALPPPKNGDSVHPDSVALMVRETVEKAVAGIRLPKDGEPGRDALDLEVLDGIDPRKSYPAGTFALHDGGTVLALRDTDSLETVDGVVSAGWKVTQDGIKEVLREETDDERMTRLAVFLTSGKRFTIDCPTSSGLKDQGPHRPGMKYRAGDCVTFDESYWVAKRDTQKSPPGEDWRLILKGKRR